VSIAEEISIVQAEITAELLPDTCNIYSYSNVADGQGGYTETASGTVSVACRLDRMKSNSGEKLEGGAIDAQSQWILTTPHDTVITEDNKVEHDSVLYNVTFVDNGQSWNATRRVTLEKA